MARLDAQSFEGLPEGLMASADTFYQLGVMYATGRDVPTDLITAHKWFNLSAYRGNSEAARMRHEIAGEMSSAEIADAQRLAREFLRTQH